MGTNYYFYTPSCPHCGRSDPPRHIGKSSGGWCFALHVYPEEGIKDIENWEVLWASSEGYIQDEDGNRISPKRMWYTIADRAGLLDSDNSYVFSKNKWTDQDYRRNEAEPGPHGLVRHKVDGHRVIGHGAGTWDLCVGEFS